MTPGHHRRRGTRTRRRISKGEWTVAARVERFVEPALLLLLSSGEAHGYELAERLGELLPDERVDFGNLYRLLRALEEEGLVTSRWQADAPGPAKRAYAITNEGRSLLDAWAGALEHTKHTIGEFLRRYHEESS
jgi:poly-beta-hydroxybutyrate-responsive repressor